MHLTEKAKQGLNLPPTLPSELHPSSSVVSSRKGPHERTRTLSEDSPVTFEDKLKENFEQGRLELERRRKTRQEKIEKEEVGILFVYCYCFLCLLL